MKLIKSIIDEKIKTIAVDFDGTLCEREKFPKIGSPKIELIEWLIEQKKQRRKNHFVELPRKRRFDSSD